MPFEAWVDEGLLESNGSFNVGEFGFTMTC
jgi:hypothetical protein